GESSEESTAHTARLSGCYSREGLAQGIGAVVTGAACCYTGIDRCLTGAASLGTGIGITTGAATGTSTPTGTGIATGTGCTGKIGAIVIRSRGTSPSNYGGTSSLYGGESGGPVLSGCP
ncbi:hypothetical protein KI387_016734, partial [Taxus chinensis]